MQGNRLEQGHEADVRFVSPKGNGDRQIEGFAPPWFVSCDPADGARLTRLSVAGRELLTPPPRGFRPPENHSGRYETRPVYGYDDCWPTVDPCPDPNGHGDWDDHGELCWRPWRVAVERGELRAETKTPGAQARFVRQMQFDGFTLRWVFSLTNTAAQPLRFLHVMHGLMPIDRVTGLDLPACETVIDEITGAPACDGGEAAAWLMARPERTAEMILLRGIRDGRMAVHWQGGGQLEIGFSACRFPTLAVWWNRGGFPDEEGRRRRECAFEPMAGPWSSLARSAAAGATQVAPARTRLEWTVEWTWKEPPHAADS